MALRPDSGVEGAAGLWYSCGEETSMRSTLVALIAGLLIGFVAAVALFDKIIIVRGSGPITVTLPNSGEVGEPTASGSNSAPSVSGSNTEKK